MGKMNLHFTHKQEYEIPDQEGHLVSLRHAEGTNESFGEFDFMQGAHVVNLSFDDLVKGNGPHQGYATLSKGNDLVVSKWEGKITTRLNEDNVPVTGFEGTNWWIKTAGKYANMEAKGIYRGYFTSESTYMVEWEGEFWMKG